MKYDPAKHHRRSIRLKGYDYSQPGAYFITICTHQRQPLFGQVINGVMELNACGRLIDACWRRLPNHFCHVQMDAHVVMPDHLHGIVILTDRSRKGEAFGQASSDVSQDHMPNASPLRPLRLLPDALPLSDRGTSSGSVGAIVQNFKSVSTRSVNRINNAPGTPLWQRNYYERILRDEAALQRVRHYIRNNPIAWHHDR